MFSAAFSSKESCTYPNLFVFIVSLRTFFSGWTRMMYSLGEYRQNSVTYALRLIVTHSVVIWI